MRPRAWHCAGMVSISVSFADVRPGSGTTVGLVLHLGLRPRPSPKGDAQNSKAWVNGEPDDRQGGPDWPWAATAGNGCLCGIRVEVGPVVVFVQATGLGASVCKSVAKATKVRILHLPPRARRVPDLRNASQGPFCCCPAVTR
jgi:hypothetical protein